LRGLDQLLLSLHRLYKRAGNLKSHAGV
jgi:hypothetical protein